MKKIALLLLGLALLWIPQLRAEKQIPDPLRTWKDWATWYEKDPESPTAYNDANRRINVWPSALNLEINRAGGKFDFTLTVYVESWVPLLDSNEVWPFQVQGNNAPLPVVEHQGVPSVHLKPGTWHITGTYRWDEIPQRIILPQEIGILNLTVEGKKVDSPAWDASGSLWLKRTPTVEPAEKDFLGAKIYRVIDDGIPMWLNTQVELSVSGKSREENLQTILPEGWSLAGVDSQLPTIVDDQGRMKVQVRPGKWIISVNAFRSRDTGDIRYAKDATPAVSQELIAFRAKPDFRTVEVTGVPRIDVTQTTFPGEWRNLPVYGWNGKESFKLEERLRGMGTAKLEGLRISRELWLDDHGGKFTFRDQITGNGQQIWRLDVAENTELGSVHSRGQGQLITKNPETQAPGVEIRSRNINLDATGRLDLTKGLSATGWRADADSLSVRLHLPPGWRLFAVFGGTDYVYGDWLTSWSLLDLFLLLVFSLAVFRMYGIGAGILAFLAFGLAYHEPGAPRYLWLILLVPLAILPWLKEGWGRSFLVAWKYLIALGLLLVLVPFIIHQIQGFLYPQLGMGNIADLTSAESSVLALILIITPCLLLVMSRGQLKSYKLLLEYGLVLFIVALVAFTVLGVLGTSIKQTFNTITETLSDLPQGGAPFAGDKGELVPVQCMTTPPPEPGATADALALPQATPAGPSKNLELNGTVYAGQSASQAQSAAQLAKREEADQKMVDVQKELRSPDAAQRGSLQLNALKRAMEQPTSQNLAYDSKAKIQTGPGLPEWRGKVVSFGWNSPVKEKQQVYPILISLEVARVLTLLRVALLLALAVLLLDLKRVRIPLTTAFRVLVIGFLILGAMPSTTQAQSSIPDEATLQKLKERLLDQKKLEHEKSDAYPNAAEIPDVSISLKDHKVSYDAEIHVATWTSVPLPGRLPAWSPLTVLVDGKSDVVIARENGLLWVVLPAGVHHVRVEGLLPEVTEWEWSFQLKPHHVTIDAPEWTVTGVRPGGIPEQQIFFAMKQKVVASNETGYGHQDYHAIAQLDRHLEMGLIWQVHNEVRRLSGEGKAISLRIPLLAGEKVLSSNEIVKDGFIEVRLGAHEESYAWDSEMSVANEISLTTKVDDAWVEQWHVVASPVWNFTLSGLAPVFEVNGADLVPTWNPWPGEKVELKKINRPEAMLGATVTVQHVDHVIHLGLRQRASTLVLRVECSLGEEFPITLPKDAEITSLSVNGAAMPVRKDGDNLVVQLHPGLQNIAIDWKTSTDLGFSAKADAIHLPVESTNINTTFDMPDSRWVLWTHGPLMGPAVRLWGILLVSLIFGGILGQLKLSPLRSTEWMLLAIGLTQVHLLAALVIIAWLFLLAWRGKNSDLTPWKFNLVQLGVIIFTLASIGILIEIVRKGLLGEPEMFIVGNGSNQHYLQWYLSRADGDLSQAGCVSVSIWVYRVLMLLWALWLASSLIYWLKFGWEQFSKGGFIQKVTKTEAPKTTTPSSLQQS